MTSTWTPLAGDSHGVALRLLAGLGAVPLHQASSLENPVHPEDTEVDPLLGQVVGQTPWAVAGAASQGQHLLSRGLNLSGL